MEALFSYKNFTHAFAGTVGGSMAMSLFYPLDALRTRLQLDSRLSAVDEVQRLLREDPAFFFRGIAPVLQALAASNFVYFYSAEYLKGRARRFRRLKSRQGLAVADSLIVGYAAGLVNVWTTCPLWVASTRIRTASRATTAEKKQSLADSSLLSTVVAIGRQSGVRELWSGATASSVLVVNPTIQFVIYESLKGRVLRRQRAVTALQAFAMALVAKFVATVLTFPVQVAQTRLRAAARSLKRAQRRHLLQLLVDIYQAEGIQGLFSGLSVKLVQTSLTASFHFVAYEKIVQAVIFYLQPMRQRI